MQTIYMTPEEWYRVPGNERQRNTEKHANEIEHILRVPKEQHWVVHAAVLPNGMLIKLDGHTRALLWHERRIPVPKMLTVLVFEAENIESASKQYELYDSDDSVEKSPDKVFGAFRENHYEPTGSILKRGNVSSALRLAEYARTGVYPTDKKDWDVYSAVNQWIKELKSLDTIISGRDNTRMHSGCVAAYLLSARKHGAKKVFRFWDDFTARADGFTRDPHVVLATHMLSRKTNKRTGGTVNTKDIAEKALAAVEHAMEDRSVTHLKGIPLTKYLKGDTKKRKKSSATRNAYPELFPDPTLG